MWWRGRRWLTVWRQRVPAAWTACAIIHDHREAIGQIGRRIGGRGEDGMCERAGQNRLARSVRFGRETRDRAFTKAAGDAARAASRAWISGGAIAMRTARVRGRILLRV